MIYSSTHLSTHFGSLVSHYIGKFAAMGDEKRNKLVRLDSEILADALIKIAEHDEIAERLINRLISEPDDIIKSFRRKIAGLKRRKRFIPRKESKSFAAELDHLLEDLEQAKPDPGVGMSLIASFLETDQAVFGNCDDSFGYIGDVYRNGARNLFTQYASRCTDKYQVLDLMIRTFSNDPFSVREGLIDKGLEMLGEEATNNAIHLFELLSEEAEDEYQKSHYFRAIESLARQTGNAELFERIRLQSTEDLGVSSCIDIGRVYLESGFPKKALEWINKISSNETFMDRERREILQEIYGRLGDSQREAELAWISFRKNRNLHTLDSLLKVIGEEKREQVIDDEAGFIIEDGKTDYSDIKFLIDVRKFDEAEICILAKAGAQTLNGYYYETLLPMAKVMESEARMLAAYVIYRALLESILERKFYKAYPHAAKYLRKLDLLGVEIEDWQDLGEHGMYHVWLNQVHGKKSSFWKHYRGE